MLLFQFHKGTIRTQRDIASMTIQQNFNSIKVRLELKKNTINRYKYTISIP